MKIKYTTKLPEVLVNKNITDYIWSTWLQWLWTKAKWFMIDKAPIHTWKLRKNIKTKVDKLANTVEIWTKVKYWRLREYVNNKNPHTRFYVKRTQDQMKPIVQEYYKKQVKKFLKIVFQVKYK